jgi:hypothetical protein
VYGWMIAVLGLALFMLVCYVMVRAAFFPA